MDRSGCLAAIVTHQSLVLVDGYDQGGLRRLIASDRRDSLDRRSVMVVDFKHAAQTISSKCTRTLEVKILIHFT